MEDGMTRYEIRAGTHAPCELVMVNKIANWPEVHRLVCEGTHTYCQQIKRQLEGK